MTRTVKNVLYRMMRMFFWFTLILLLWTVLSECSVQADSIGELKIGETNKHYDVTGDQKADTIKLTPGGKISDFYTSLKITVNGKRAYTIKEPDGVNSFEAKVLSLSNGSVFLYISGYGMDDDGPARLLQYDNSTREFSEIADVRSLFQSYCYHFSADIQSVKGNVVVIRASMQSYSLAGVTVDVTYKYKSGTLKREKNMSIASMYSGRTLTANKKMTAYTAASCSKKAFVIKKGTEVTIQSLAFRNGKLAIRVKMNGKTGWLRAAASLGSKPPFQELSYAG